MKTVVRSLEVLEAVARRQPIGVGELSRALELPKSTVQRILVTLGGAGWLAGAGDPVRWSVTDRVLAVARSVTREVDLREAALGSMRELGDATAETIHLSVPAETGIVLIERIDSTQPVRVFNELGAWSPMHTTASGRVVLAFLPPERLDKLLERGLERLTEHTIVDPDELRAELRRVAELGYAVNVGQNRVGVCAVSAPIFDASGAPVASISISMPDTRFDPGRVGEWAKLVMRTADDIGARLRR